MEATQESVNTALGLIDEYRERVDKLWEIIESQKKTIAGYDDIVVRYEALVKTLQGEK